MIAVIILLVLSFITIGWLATDLVWFDTKVSKVSKPSLKSKDDWVKDRRTGVPLYRIIRRS